ncbi:hypothetical protein ACK3YL_20050 [Aeromonas caviae]
MLTAIMLLFSTGINVYALLQIRRSARALDALVASQMKLKEICIAQQVSVPAHEFSINELRGTLVRARH